MSEIQRRIELTPHDSLMRISDVDSPPGVAVVGKLVPFQTFILELSNGTSLAIRCARCQLTCTTLPPDRNPIAWGYWIDKQRCPKCGSAWTLVSKRARPSN